MSPREKKLLIFFAVGAFVIVNFIGFNFFLSSKQDFHRNHLAAEKALDEAKLYSASRDKVLDQMEWLGQHEPQPAAYQDVQSNLQQLIEREAGISGLTIRPNSQKLLPTDETAGHHYHRVKVQVTVTGMNQALFSWFDRLNDPNQFRATTNIRLSPDREDPTKIDCTAIIEQWFVPASQS